MSARSTKSPSFTICCFPMPLRQTTSTTSQSRGGRVLELGCGSGRLTIPLARAELDIVGIDISESMLAYARKKASAANVNVEFQLADMRDFDLPEKFSTIFAAGNSLLHLLDNANLQRCLSCVRRHLSRDGR